MSASILLVLVVFREAAKIFPVRFGFFLTTLASKCHPV